MNTKLKADLALRKMTTRITISPRMGMYIAPRIGTHIGPQIDIWPEVSTGSFKQVQIGLQADSNCFKYTQMELQVSSDITSGTLGYRFKEELQKWTHPSNLRNGIVDLTSTAYSPHSQQPILRARLYDYTI